MPFVIEEAAKLGYKIDRMAMSGGSRRWLSGAAVRLPGRGGVPRSRENGV